MMACYRFGFGSRPDASDGERNATPDCTAEAARPHSSTMRPIFDRMPDVLGVHEAAQSIHVSDDTMRMYLKTGVIPGVQSARNGRWLIGRDVLVAYVHGELVGKPAEPGGAGVVAGTSDRTRAVRRAGVARAGRDTAGAGVARRAGGGRDGR